MSPCSDASHVYMYVCVCYCRELRNTKDEQDMKLSHVIKEKFAPRVRRVTQVSYVCTVCMYTPLCVTCCTIAPNV